MENEKQLPKLGIENTMDFGIECSKIESITADKGVTNIQIKEGSIYPFDCQHVIKTFPDHVLIDELSRRHPNLTIKLNEITSNKQ